MSFTLGEMEKRFWEIIRENEGVSSGELVGICAEQLGWKKSTTYTMLRRLCDKGVCENSGGQVRSLMSKEDVGAIRTEEILNENFGGSLPRFIAAFADRHRLSRVEIDEIQKLIDDYRKE